MVLEKRYGWRIKVQLPGIQKRLNALKRVPVKVVPLLVFINPNPDTSSPPETYPDGEPDGSLTQRNLLCVFLLQEDLYKYGYIPILSRSRCFYDPIHVR